jgi:uncharacterized membrane protein
MASPLEPGATTRPPAAEQLAQQLLGTAYADLIPIQKSVIDLIALETPSILDPRQVHDERTFGQRLADQVARIGGSWAFIIGFGVALAAWMVINRLMQGTAFDPYPFIFLNLLLSMLAAVQAPLIMMSQNRQAAKDRKAVDNDFVVNLRAELEIMHLHDKLDEIRAALSIDANRDRASKATVVPV